MASMASSIVTHSFRPSPSGNTVAKIPADAVAALGHCRHCGLEPLRWDKVGCSGGNSRGGNSRSRLLRVRAAVEEEEADGRSNSRKSSSSAAVETTSENATTSGTGGSNSVSDKKAAARAEIERGRNTALITGAISVLLGVGYLVLLQLLDTRGIELIPPPPEAFDP